MSMITRCPECFTQFKVVADQLRIAEGWVRCGQCTHVFDGNANLQPGVEPDEGAPRVSATPTDTEPEQTTPVEVVAEVEVSPQEAVDEGQAYNLVLPGESSATRTQAHDLQPDLGQALVAQQAQWPEHEAPTELPERLEAQAQEQDLVLPQVSFVRTAQRQAFWARRAVRWALGVTCLLLSLGLALQVVLYERDQIAALQPQARPGLQAMCEVLGCSLAPLKRKDAISVESSDFRWIRTDVYRLSVTLKNSSATELALPALELTLTDLHDAALLRRVLLPADFAAGSRTIAAGAEMPVALSVSVAGAGGASRVVGYRVFAFYP